MSPNQIENIHDQNILAKMVTRAFELWKLDTKARLSLLSLPADDLLAIHASLRLLFPQNRDLAYAWMTQRNRAFDNLTPVAVIQERGLPGLLAVRAYLDQARGN